MNTGLFRWAFALIFISLIGAFFVPVAAIPRLAVFAAGLSWWGVRRG